MRKFSLSFAIFCLGLTGHAQVAVAPTATVHARVEVAGKVSNVRKRREAIPKTVIWLTPSTPGDGTSEQPPAASSQIRPSQTWPSQTRARLVQKNKSFEPHVLVVPSGSDVEFPNRDPFFHNVFSLFEGKRFDLGLYEAGSSRVVRFDRPGISYIFCNIHPEMSAIIIAMTTPLYGVSNPEGEIALAGVPFGHYVLHVWSEGMGAENTQPITRDVTVAETTSSLGAIRVPEATGQSMAHKNKYGRNYDNPTPDSSVYDQPR